MQIEKLDLGLIDRNEEQPRQVFEAAALRELADSIAENGLQQPICVRPKADGRYEIVYGERRFRAHRLLADEGRLNPPTIPAMIREMDEGTRDIEAILENLARKDINPMEEARAYQRMLDRGWTAQDLAKRLGLKQVRSITDRTRLLNLRPQYQDGTEKNLISPWQANFMSQLTTCRQDRFFQACRSGKAVGWRAEQALFQVLLDDQNQAGMFSAKEMGEPSDEEKEALTRFEALVSKMASTVSAGFNGQNGIDLARKVQRERARELADKLALIEKHCGLLRSALSQVALQAEMELAA